MPLHCGRYLWEDEPVTVWMEEGELIAATSDYSDTPEEIDRMFRDENSEQHQVCMDRPWLLIGDCYEEECSQHNVQEHTTPRNEA